MGKLRILFLCPQPLWPINTGARLRNFHLANALAESCDVSILQIFQPGETLEPYPSKPFQEVISAVRGKSYTPWKLFRGLTGPLPVTVLNYTANTVAEALAAALASSNFDAVQMESIHLFRYLEVIQKSPNPPVAVLDWHNIESELMQRFAESTANPAKKLIAARTAVLLEKLEDRALHSFRAHTVVSQREKEKLLARAPSASIHVIPNGVAIADFAHGHPSSFRNSDRKTLLFVGSMDYHANSDAIIWFCREIWPRISAEFPNLDFKIVGRNPPASVQALASSRIQITGTVPSVKPFYDESFAVVVPLRVGGGTRLKILEAMAAGVPVISTTLGAEGIAVENHREILLADTAEEMTASIRALLHDPALILRLREASLALVNAQYDWLILGQNLSAVYRAITN